jgi:hypothetical protein
MMRSSGILSILTILGLRNPYRKNQLAKQRLYRAYTATFGIMFGLSLMLYEPNLFGYQISNLMILVDAIMFFLAITGNFLIYLESLFYRQELDLIMEEFSEIDEILLEDYGIEINYGKFEKLLRKVSIGLVIFTIIQGYFLAMATGVLIGITVAFTVLVPCSLIIEFWFICLHLKIRFDKIEKFFSSKADDQILEVHYRMVQTIFLRASNIIKLSNKFFQFKFLVIFRKLSGSIFLNVVFILLYFWCIFLLLLR